MIDGELPASEAVALAERLRDEAREHLPMLEVFQLEIKTELADHAASTQVSGIAHAH